MFITIICSIGLSACIPNDNPEYYSVSFIVDGTLYHSDTVKWKDSLTFPANPVKGGYDFDGWYEGENKITEIRQGYKEEITLTAKWNIINYTITYQLDGGTNSTNNPSTFTVESQTISLSEPAKIGYRFLGWYNNESKITEIPQGFNQNIILSAKWEIDTDSTCFLFNFENGYVITGLKDESVTSITIPDYVTAIDGYAFLTNPNIETVIFAENSQCKTIGEYAFQYCDALKEISIPASIEAINSSAFYMCMSLEKITFEKGSKLEIIGDAAFSDCYALEKIEIPVSVTSIGASSFSGCLAI